MSSIHLLSFFGTDNPEDGYAKRQQHLHQSASTHGGITKHHPWNRDMLRETEFYKAHREILDQKRGAGYWLWKPYLILKLLHEIPEGDFLVYHDVGRAIRRNIHVGYEFTRSIQPLIDWTEHNGGIYPGVAVPIYGPNKKWIKRDCFVLMDCDSEKYWNHCQIQASFNIWQNLPATQEFIKEWLHYCSNPRILTDIPDQCKEPAFDEFEDHRHDQSILTNMVIKYQTPVYGNVAKDTFKYRDINHVLMRVVSEQLAATNEISLETIALRHDSSRIQKSYLSFYKLFLEEYRRTECRILEIHDSHDRDCATSAAMWAEYMPYAEIHSIHVLPSGQQEHGIVDRVVHHPVDPSHRPSLEITAQQLQKAGKLFDFIIDSGSGLMRDQQLAIGTLFHLLKPGGVFFIEGMENTTSATFGDMNTSLSNSTLQLIRRINRPTLQVTSHYFTLAESRRIEKLAQGAGVHVECPGAGYIGMIRRTSSPELNRS